MEIIKPKIRKFLSWYECEGDGVWMSGNTIEESYQNWLKAWENTQRLKNIQKKAVEAYQSKNL